MSLSLVHQPVCDEGGVGFVARRLAENPTLLWSHHIILRSDETWLPELSGILDGVQRWRSSVAWGDLGQASLSAYGVKPVDPFTMFLVPGPPPPAALRLIKTAGKPAPG